MLVDQDAHPPHNLPNRSRHGSGTACHDRQALVPPLAPLAHPLAHSRSDGHQAQPEGLETIPSRSAQGWHLPREARSRLERSVEACIGHVSRAAGCHMPGSAWPPRFGIGIKLFVLGLRLTLASHGDLDVGDRLHGILRPLKEVTAAVAMALGADVDLGDILWSRTGFGARLGGTDSLKL